ncbi:MAG: hypothetical protein ABI334_07960 [Candidatus Dormiibacterota bacterium]
MAKWNPLALKILMWVMGLLLVVGSALSFIGNSFFQFDSTWGISAPVAGIAFGTGVMIAGFDPIANVTWVRAVIVYAILEIVWQVLDWISIGRFDVIPFVVAIVVAVLLLALYPNRPALWMQGSMKGMGARA